ncbi:Tetratricopeptide repeat-containing protein [Tenacibaculum sp. MAR_2009_124]|uniref:helix-turn-helix transcriptional regulator n=1 Tax=Tenacibaculum sp. MAR_2009_124 TaxID=1250059 RepID=UPI0008978E50|nr:hypothetical protein [Tenacibaculum sp. MAR_2009_124]SEB39778.1 Tetratricopeptide repeat-containing protein [Tenacibaculum sp. MAR_2009_124]
MRILNMIQNRIFIVALSLFLLLRTNINGQSNELLLTKENLSDKISEVYQSFYETEDTGEIENLLIFLKRNGDIILHDTIKAKLLFLDASYQSLALRRYKEADNLLKKSLEYATKTKDYLLTGMIFNDRAVLNTSITKDYNKSNVLYIQAIESYRKVGNKKKIIESYYNLTHNSRNLNKYEEAIKWANICLDMIGDDNDRLIYYKRIFYLIADSYIKLNDYNKAKEYIKILENHLNNSDLRSRTRTYAWFHQANADLDVSKGDYISATENLKKSIISWQKLNNENRKSINESYERELFLEKEVRREKEVIISDQRMILFISFVAIILLFGFIFMLIFFFRRNKRKNEQIVGLNKELNELIVSLKDNNSILEDRKKEIESLLKLNEQSLFSRILKISTYNDTIGKISDDIDAYMDSSPSASGYLMAVRKKLKALISEDELWKDFKIQFEKIRPEFFNKLKEVSSSLSVNDLKHCTYIVSNLKSKEVAQLINVSPRSVETTRYRIKKKLGLEKEDSLYDLLSNL